MIPITDAAIDVYHPGDDDGDPSLTVPDRRINAINYSERLGHRKDSGRLTLVNDGGEYTDEIRSGARLECRVTLGGRTLNSWGAGNWGDSMWSGERFVWTAVVRDRELSRRGPQTSDLILECQDFCFGVLDMRETYAAFDAQPVVAILSSVLDETAPEIKWHVDPALDDEITTTYNGRTALTVIDDLLVGSDAVARAYRNWITIRPFEAPTRSFTATSDDVGRLSVSETDEMLINDIRVNGSRGDALDPAATEESVARTKQVTQDDRLRFQIPTRKSEVSTVELYTKRRSEDTLIVRLQKDDDGRPIAPDDRSSDITHNEQPYHFVSDDDWTEIQLPSETLPEPNPWVLIESGGDTGHGIGVALDGTPAHRIYYPYRVAISDYDSESIGRYRRREGSISAENASLDESRDIAAREIARGSSLQQVVGCEAASKRAHMLRPGEIVALPFEREGVGGEFVVSERTDSYDGTILETELTFEQQFDAALSTPEQ